MLEASLYIIHAMIVHEMATWETAGAKEDRRRPTRSRSRRPRGSHGARIACLDGLLALAAAALHQLQRGLPELQQLLACYGRERLHRGYERSKLLHDGVVRGRHALIPAQLLKLRRRRSAKGAQHKPPRWLP